MKGAGRSKGYSKRTDIEIARSNGRHACFQRKAATEEEEEEKKCILREWKILPGRVSLYRIPGGLFRADRPVIVFAGLRKGRRRASVSPLYVI